MSAIQCIWLVIGNCGEYSDYQQWNVGAFTTETAANEWAAALVVSRIAEYDADREEAQRAQRDLESRVRFLMGKFKSYGINPDYVPPPPEKLYRKDDKGDFVEATNEQY